MLTAESTIGVGDRVAFTDRGCLRRGKVVGVEVVGEKDRDGRRPGRWFIVRLDGSLFDTADTHEDAVLRG